MRMTAAEAERRIRVLEGRCDILRYQAAEAREQLAAALSVCRREADAAAGAYAKEPESPYRKGYLDGAADCCSHIQLILDGVPAGEH